MKLLLDTAWISYGVLKYSGLAVTLAGVAIFGFYFVRLNARAARRGQDSIPTDAWRGPGAMFGAKVFVGGIFLQVATFVLGVLLPGRL